MIIEKYIPNIYIIIIIPTIIYYFPSKYVFDKKDIKIQKLKKFIILKKINKKFNKLKMKIKFEIVCIHSEIPKKRYK